MALYDRDIPQQAHAADKVYALICAYPYGVTFEQLMQDHPDEISHRTSVFAAIELLRKESKVYSKGPWGKGDSLEKVTLYATPRRSLSSC
jgi:hypothetical protein